MLDLVLSRTCPVISLIVSFFSALEHCSQANFRAVELLTTEHHQAARSLYASKGFELIETIRKPFVGGLFSLAIYRLRISVSIIRNF